MLAGMPEAAPNHLRVSSSCQIPVDELTWRFTGSGGPGGQHANTSNTRAEVVFDIAESPSLGPRQRARLLEKLGPVVRVVASDTRSQSRNRDLALERLRSKLAAALKVEAPRRATKPSKGAKERRLSDKKRRSEVKRQRRVTGED
ncbi:MAG: ribosome-associated protein [Actinomycetota bacterium]|nr:ribosome-associated protein [Actinomycetota bacterium]